jgi:hypothetical protein
MDRNLQLWFPQAPRNAVISVVAIRGGSDYPRLALVDAAAMADRARMRRQVRDAGYSAFAAACAALKETP